jgi:glycerophosphoryl diester phosphodiesterase
MWNQKFFLLLLIPLLTLCGNSMTSTTVSIHGHRGCRGLWPENSLRGFEEAIELGCDALELDVVICSDGEILVSHDPYMHHEICNKPDSSEVTKSESEGLNIFRMSAAEAQSYWCGMRPHSRFPEQKQNPHHKPTLSESVHFVNNLLIKKNTKTSDILWNIEIKSQPDWYGIYQPEPKEYVRLFLVKFTSLGLENNCVIQSFDPQILEELHIQAPHLRLVYLNELSIISCEKKLATLSFKPYGYSPNHTLINESTVSYCKTQSIELIAWTVNDQKDFERMQRLGVKHIITDYPDQAISFFRN